MRGGQGWTHRGPRSGRAEEEGHQAPVWRSCGTVVGILTADLQRRVVEAGSMQTYPSNPSLGKLLRAAGLISVTPAATGETETH